MDGGENEMKMGGKGVKGKRRQKNGSVSSSAGNVNKEGSFDNFLTEHKLKFFQSHVFFKTSFVIIIS